MSNLGKCGSPIHASLSTSGIVQYKNLLVFLNSRIESEEYFCKTIETAWDAPELLVLLLTAGASKMINEIEKRKILCSIMIN